MIILAVLVLTAPWPGSVPAPSPVARRVQVQALGVSAANWEGDIGAGQVGGHGL